MNMREFLFARFLGGAGGGDKAVISPLEITENGTYTAKDVDGYSPVTVNVADKKVIVPLEVTENGTYSAEGVDGYYPVIVNVEASGGAQTTEFLPTTTFTNDYYSEFGVFVYFIPLEAEMMVAWVENRNAVTVVYDGEEYNVTPQVLTGAAGNDGVCVGNLSAFGGTGNNEPFAVVPWNIDEVDGLLIGSTVDQDETQHTIRIYQEAGSGAGAITADQIAEGGVAEVYLPNATKIKGYAFYLDTTLATIEMPNVKRIEGYAFQGCSNLALKTLPSGIEYIGDNAFRNCAALEITSFPSSLKYLGTANFWGVNKVTSLTFEGKPDSIHSNAFFMASALTTINVPWAEGEVAGAPWGATNAAINYNYTGG